jgi:hypothetical protein
LDQPGLAQEQYSPPAPVRNKFRQINVQDFKNVKKADPYQFTEGEALSVS